MKMPDFSELKKKVNIQGMVENVKSAIDTVSTPKAPPTADELATKFAEITELMNSLADMNAQQARAVANIKAKIQTLDKDMHSIKKMATEISKPPNSEATPSATSETIEQVKAEVVENVKADAEQITGEKADADKPTAVEEPPKDGQ